MEFLLDPTVWVGLITLVVLEIVLGVDNLVFVAILVKKLPAAFQTRALYTGLSGALLMRLVLLSVMSWLVGLTAPLFSVWEHPFSLRDLILLAGGLFLLFKATLELHERLEGHTASEGSSEGTASFWAVIAQVLVLDAVFSLDSIITAVGMVQNLGVMMTAVVIAMGVMIAASRPLTAFVNSHPTVVVLCLSFLLMIGFSLIAESLGFHIPKGYLYAAIGFSILIEFFNQTVSRNTSKALARVPFRERTTAAIVSMMTRGNAQNGASQQGTSAPAAAAAESFGQDERSMVEGVLTLAERNVKTVMTPRSDITWINLRRPVDELMEEVRSMPHSSFPVCDGVLDNVVGVVRAKDLVNMEETTEALLATARQRQPLTVPETVNVIRLMREMRGAQSTLVLVTDEFGVIQGLVTPHDVLEAIAGDFPDEGDRQAIEKTETGWSADGTVELFLVEQETGAEDLVRPDGDYVTLAGLLLDRFGHIPRKGEAVTVSGLVFTVTAATASRIERVDIRRVPQAKA